MPACEIESIEPQAIPFCPFVTGLKPSQALAAQAKIDGAVKSPTSALRDAQKGLNVHLVRLPLSKLASLEFGAFYDTIRRIWFGAVI